jgi:hypothetical protein
MECSPNGVFEDHATQAFWYRRQPVPAFTVERSDNGIEGRTQALVQSYCPSVQGFTSASLSIRLLDENVTWNFGERDLSNFLGTLRTLVDADGSQRLPNDRRITGGHFFFCPFDLNTC